MALLAVAASGCTGAEDGSAPEAPAAPAPQTLPGEGSPTLVLTGCSGVRAFANYPQGAAPGSAPPGWAPSPEPVVNVGVLALGCQRIAVGPFERGPIHLVLDWHDAALAPAACMAGAPDGKDPLVLGNVLVDDPDVAGFLHEAYGMPARGAAVVAETAPAMAAELHDWRWTADGGESRLVVGADPAVGPETWADRLFWPVGEGVGSLDLAVEGTGASVDRAAVGRLAPPMLAGDFAGLGQWHPEIEASARFGAATASDCARGSP